MAAFAKELIMRCTRCLDTYWVCETHDDRPWDGEHACGCGGAGMPCPACNEPADDERPRQPAGFTTDIDVDDDRDGVTAMANEPKLYQGHEFEVLKMCYVEQVNNLRNLNEYDLKVLGGFLTIQLGLASWFALHPPGDIPSKVIIVAVNLVVLWACIEILRGARRRRREAGAAIRKINKALGLYAPGIYLDEAIDEPRPPRNAFWLYAASCLGVVGTGLALFLPELVAWLST